MISRLCQVLFTLGTLLPVSAVASGESAASQAVNVISMLFVVLAVIGLLAYGVNRLSLGKLGAGRHMQLLEVLPLSKTERLCIVKVGEQKLLLGVSPGGIRTLSSLDELDIPEGNTSPSVVSQAADFSTILARLVKAK
ncbi:flagellar biosynthetic protein FliO [Parendozoicomonas haliclonae]|uniref:Flagellar protein n=1 Tax=Parendozoicomonas haliclonae TaxID=1960125 RepID=A0A1X7AMT8_9GAMM|nr:flagellar biosynthetic protein FliO [Parendozoicomonas haliclonae]SMA49620.1 flagellar biosynthesis protein FliO [Parendozoicomonas haliclonae]